MKTKIVPVLIIFLGMRALSPIYLWCVGLGNNPGMDRGFACFMFGMALTFLGATIGWMP